MSRKSETEGPLRSPLFFGRVSNGEYAPSGPSWAEAAERHVLRLADERSRRLGISRRAFLQSALGTAAALETLNLAACHADPTTPSPTDHAPGHSSATGHTGGGSVAHTAHSGGTYHTGEDACDADAIRERLSGDFVMDVQTHHVDADPSAPWLQDPAAVALLSSFATSLGCPSTYECLGQAAYLQDVFVHSDTTVAVMSAIPGVPGLNAQPQWLMDETTELVNQLAASQRQLRHGKVWPELGQSERDRLGDLSDVAGFKLYTIQNAAGGLGWFLDGPEGLAFLDEMVRVGAPPLVCLHKGLSLGNPFGSPRDIGPCAVAYPQLTFVVYHSGWEIDVVEGPYDPRGGGVDRLIKTLADSGIGPGGNVYAEIGALWRNLMFAPDQAAHVLGKLLVALGPERILWGTDCIWFGSPQPLIEAFRAFEITEAFQSTYGYPALTPQIKARILGLNAAELYGVDPTAVRCTLADELAELPARWPSWREHAPPVFGPTTPRDYHHLLLRGGH
ncbi:MAG: amidohydrolase family protein [Myxococcales bacterium]|nr:amidohydrolase family protein [Myxococcales bacterium]